MHRRQLVQVVHYHLCRFLFLEFDEDTHAFAVRLVSDIGDAIEPLVPHKLRNAFDEFRLVDLERDLRHHDGFAVLGDFLDGHSGAQRDDPPPCRIGRSDAGAPIDKTRRREIGTRNER